MEESLYKKTGKTLEAWKAIVKLTGIERHREMINYLKSEHGMTHGFANFVAMKTREADAASFDAEDLVGMQYGKGKEALRPIYERILEHVQQFGDDVEVAPKKAAVSLRRKRQFALVQPSTKTRVDLGLKFNNKTVGERLGNSGPFGTMCTHRVKLSAEEEVDEEVLAWLREAYEQAG